MILVAFVVSIYLGSHRKLLSWKWYGRKKLLILSLGTRAINHECSVLLQENVDQKQDVLVLIGRTINSFGFKFHFKVLLLKMF